MDTTSRIREYVVEEILAGTAPKRFDEDTPLLRGLVDSAALMQLVAFIEEEFDVELDEADITPQHFGTVRDLARLVDRRSEALGAGDTREGTAQRI
jgi:acyl carrier protein